VTALVHELRQQALNPAHVFDLGDALAHLHAADGGYEIVHESARLEIGIYVLIAPEPDQQRTNGNDAVYLVLEGRGTLDLDGERIELCEGRAAFVPAGADFRFSSYEQLSMLVIANRGTSGQSIGASPQPET
jgi:mannose-6-phosphate isomerase-like protein (cupin superfamily)